MSLNLAIERVRIRDALALFFGVEAIPPTKNAAGVILTVGVSVDEQTRAIEAQLGNLGLMLSGGAINSVVTGMSVNDLDFYIKDSKKVAQAANYLSTFFKEPQYVSRNAITFKRKAKTGAKRWTAQLITRFTGDARYILNTFDFTITQGLFDFETNEFVFGDRFFQDIAAKKLVYLGSSHYPICAMYRTKKYAARGYTVPGSTIMHIALSIVRLDIKTYRDLKDQLMGIDTIYLQGLLSGDKYADALPVDYATFLVEAFEEIDGVPDVVPSDLKAHWEDNISPAN